MFENDLSYRVTLPEMKSEFWSITKFTTSDVPNFRLMLQGRSAPTNTEFTILHRIKNNNKTLVMSDTPAEYNDHLPFIQRAEGHVLIAGLGIGMVIKNIIDKVDHITVIELSQDLIDLVHPYYASPKLTVICADIMTWKPPKNTKYDAVWFDIWDDICADNIKDMKTLHRRYKRRSYWVNSWCYSCCLKMSKR